MVKREKHIEQLYLAIKDNFDIGDLMWSKVNIGSPISTNVRYLYPRSEMETTRIYRLSDTDKKNKNDSINIPNDKNFRIKSIQGLDSKIDYTSSAIKYDNGNRIVDTSCFSGDDELFMTITANDIPRDFLRTLIDLRVSEVSSREEMEYEKHWIVAAIKDETIFTPIYSKTILDDVEVDVGIQVGKHYSTVLQKHDTPLLRLIRTNQDILKATDKGNRDLLRVSSTRRWNILQREVKKRKESVYSILSNMCLPDKFKEYLSIDNPNLSLIDSRRSEQLLTLSNILLPIPSGMQVQVFTSLDENKPAQRGHLIFNRKTFQDDVEKILRSFYKLS